MKRTLVNADAQKRVPRLAALKDCPGAEPLEDGGLWIDSDSECFQKIIKGGGQKTTVLIPRLPARRPKGTAGTKLKAIFSSLGVDPVKDCNCGAKADWMDQAGDARCRQEFEKILAWLKEGQRKYGWATRACAAMNAVKLGYVTQPGFLDDPLRWILNEAITQSEADAAAANSSA